MFLVILNEFSNGFPSNTCFEFKDKEKAINGMSLTLLDNRHFYKEYGTILKDTETLFVAEENNNKGDGIRIEIVNEDDVMKKIISKIKESKNTYTLKTIGENDEVSVEEVPVLNLDKGLPYTLWNNKTLYSLYQPLYIIERKTGDEVIYDVYMNKTDNEMLEKDLYVESLDTVGYNILSNIYSSLD